jgi:hypothetical protein
MRLPRSTLASTASLELVELDPDERLTVTRAIRDATQRLERAKQRQLELEAAEFG